MDWRSLKNRGIRDRLESAFNVVEREYGVTRLLDPEGKARFFVRSFFSFFKIFQSVALMCLCVCACVRDGVGSGRIYYFVHGEGPWSKLKVPCRLNRTVHAKMLKENRVIYERTRMRSSPIECDVVAMTVASYFVK